MQSSLLGAPWTNLTGKCARSANGCTHGFTAPNAIILLLGSDIHEDSLALFPHHVCGDIIFISFVLLSCLDPSD